jgi:hypothetical protein
MTSFRAEPINRELARKVRASRRDPFGGEAEMLPVSGPGFPCRHCLEETSAGEEVVLLSYQPLARQTPYAGRGPIFICAADCHGYRGIDAIPKIVAGRTVNLRAYDAAGRMLYEHARLSNGGEAKTLIAAMLSDDKVAEVHAHTALHGCFLCKFVRS